MHELLRGLLGIAVCVGGLVLVTSGLLVECAL